MIPAPSMYSFFSFAHYSLIESHFFQGSTLGGRRKSKRSATKPLKNKDEDQEDAGDDKGSEKGRSHRIKPKDKHLRSGSESSALATPSVGVALVETSKKRSHSHRKAKSAKGSRDKEKEKGAPEFPGDVKIEAPKLSEILVVNSPRTSALIVRFLALLYLYMWYEASLSSLFEWHQ